MTEVVIAGGGTGGHLFPGLAVAAALAERGVAVSWLGAARGLEAIRVPEAGIPLRLLPVTGAIGRSRLAQAGAGLRLVPGFALAFAHLLRRRPAALLAVGGYAALPGALAAAALGIPVVLQEQNAVPGVTNRLLAPWSVAIACGFREALSWFPSLPARWTGNPVRAAFFAVAPGPAAPAGALVLGGSQGSAFLNQVLPEAFAVAARQCGLPPIVHQAGPRWADDVRMRYAAHGVTAEVVPFIEDPAGALARAGLVVARAGALTVSELAAARRPALLVPFAAAAHGHQLANARALESCGAAEVLEEREASPQRVADSLTRLLADPVELAERGRAGAALVRPEAAADIAALLLSRSGFAPEPHHGREAA